MSAGLKSDHFDAVILALPTHAAAKLARHLQPRTLRRTRRHRLQLFHHRRPRLRSRSPPVTPSRLRISGARAAKANACWPQLSSTTSFLTAPPKIAPCCAASSPDRTPKISGSSPTTPSSPSSATNCSRSSASAPRRSSPASINGSPPWPSTASAISNASTASSACASSCPALALAGNGYRGIGVPDCVRSGHEAAKQVVSAYRTIKKSFESV